MNWKLGESCGAMQDGYEDCLPGYRVVRILDERSRHGGEMRFISVCYSSVLSSTSPSLLTQMKSGDICYVSLTMRR